MSAEEEAVHDPYDLELTEANLTALLELLRTADKYPDRYRLEYGLRHDQRGRQVVRIVLDDGSEPCVQYVTGNFIGGLDHRGWFRYDSDLPRNGRRFSDDAMDGFRLTRRMNDMHLQRELGDYFLERHDQGDNPEGFDVAAFAARFNTAPHRVAGQLRRLVSCGFLSEVTALDASAFTGLRMTEAGVRWAMNGYKLAPDANAAVQVDVRVDITINQFLLALGAAEVDQATKEQLAAAAEAIQRKPTLERLATFMGLAADTATVAPALKFIIDNAGAVQHALSTLRL